MSMQEAAAPPRAGAMKVMDPTGHTEITWDADVPAEVAVAKAAFKELTEQKGYQAFRVGRNGRQDERMREFDPEAEKVLMIPQLKGG